MAAFSQITALQCIPQFDGNPDELDVFIRQIELFAEQLEGEDHTPLLNVVYLKLTGKALKLLSKIDANTWPEVKRNLEDEFKFEKSAATLMKEIETLLQKENESFDDYSIRVEDLHKWVANQGRYATNSLRKHFLGGLRDRGLAHAGKSQREKTLPELLTWLKKEIDEGNEIDEIFARVTTLDLLETKKNNKINDNQNNKFLPVQNLRLRNNRYSNGYVQSPHNKITYSKNVIPGGSYMLCEHPAQIITESATKLRISMENRIYLGMQIFRRIIFKNYQKAL